MSTVKAEDGYDDLYGDLYGDDDDATAAASSTTAAAASTSTGTPAPAAASAPAAAAATQPIPPFEQAGAGAQQVAQPPPMHFDPNYAARAHERPLNVRPSDMPDEG